MALVNDIKNNVQDYKVIAEHAFNREHNLWERPMYQDNPAFQQVKSQYGTGEHKVVRRQQVIDLFAEGKYYDAYLCAMVWGNIGTYRKGRRNFESAFGVTRSYAETHIADIVSILSKGDIGSAFDSMCIGGSNHFPGLGVSFFTKVLYFAGATICEDVSPLILDSNTLMILARLYNDSGITQTPRQTKAQYLFFCSEMARMSSELELPTPGHLEAFLFNDGKVLL